MASDGFVERFLTMWSIILIPTFLVRLLSIKKKISEKESKKIAIFFWVVNTFLFYALDKQNIPHVFIFIGAIITYKTFSPRKEISEIDKAKWKIPDDNSDQNK